MQLEESRFATGRSILARLWLVADDEILDGHLIIDWGALALLRRLSYFSIYLLIVRVTLIIPGDDD